MSIWQKIKDLWRKFDEFNRQNFVEMQQQELAELETVFALLTVGNFIGLPSPPSHVALEIITSLDKEFDILVNSVEKSLDSTGYLLGIFDID